MKKRFERYTKRRITSLLLLPLLSNPFPANALYDVKKGDTLSGIANEKYGNWLKWKPLWHLNEDRIKNPDLIYPGQRLKLLNEGELDLYADNDVNPNGVAGSKNDANSETVIHPKRSKKSQEWRLLPKQNWETFVFATDPTVDPDGFDRRSRVAVRVADKTTADITIASDRIPILGEIINARTDFDRIFLGEPVFVRADEPLQVGTTYSITTGPQKTVSKRDGRVGFGYDLTGKVRIIGVRDGVFIGTVTDLYYPIKRHQLLIPNVPPYEFPEAKAAPNPINASVVVTKSYQEDLLGEQKLVFLDVGKEDGVQVGNIFRHYLHTDPNTKETITSKDYLIEADLQVLAVQDKFSVAIILDGRRPLRYGDEVTALTDISDLSQNQGLQTAIQEHGKVDNIDQLDQMDQSEGLGEKENRELRQLEKWAKPAPAAPLLPETATGTDDIQRLDVHENARPTIPIGKESAPNDGTDKPQVVTPKPTPATAPTPAPTESPAPQTQEQKDEAAQGIPQAPVTESKPELNDPALDAPAAQPKNAPAPEPKNAPVPPPKNNGNNNNTVPQSNVDPFAIPPDQNTAQ